MFRIGAAGTGTDDGDVGGGGLGVCTICYVSCISGWKVPGDGWVGESCTLGSGEGMLGGRSAEACWGRAVARLSICTIWM